MSYLLIEDNSANTSADLCKAAGLPPAGLLCELVDPDDENGGIASRDACIKFAREHKLKVTSIELLKKWREEREGELPAALLSKVQTSSAEDRFRGVKMDEQGVAPAASISA